MEVVGGGGGGFVNSVELFVAFVLVKEGGAEICDGGGGDASRSKSTGAAVVASRGVLLSLAAFLLVVVLAVDAGAGGGGSGNAGGRAALFCGMTGSSSLYDDCSATIGSRLPYCSPPPRWTNGPGFGEYGASYNVAAPRSSSVYVWMSPNSSVSSGSYL